MGTRCDDDDDVHAIWRWEELELELELGRSHWRQAAGSPDWQDRRYNWVAPAPFPLPVGWGCSTGVTLAQVLVAVVDYGGIPGTHLAECTSSVAWKVGRPQHGKSLGATRN